MASVSVYEVVVNLRHGSIMPSIELLAVCITLSKTAYNTLFCLSHLPKSSFTPSNVGIFLILAYATACAPFK